jgi:hypothetical protein
MIFYIILLLLMLLDVKTWSMCSVSGGLYFDHPERHFS